MPVFGCHNCKFDINDPKYKDKPYDQLPCATCALSKDYKHTFSTGFFDTGEDDEDGRFGIYEEIYDEHAFVYDSDGVQLSHDDISTLETIVKATERRVLMSISGIILKMLRMASKSPLMFEVLVKKMQFPYMSYYEIGSTMDPKCSKQTVLYYLKQAVSAFPELQYVIGTDSRYSNGVYALRSLAKKRKQTEAEVRLDSLIFKGSGKYNKEQMALINAILKSPVMVRDEVYNFNPYVQDENHVRDIEDEFVGEGGQGGPEVQGPESGPAEERTAVDDGVRAADKT